LVAALVLLPLVLGLVASGAQPSGVVGLGEEGLDVVADAAGPEGVMTRRRIEKSTGVRHHGKDAVSEVLDGQDVVELALNPSERVVLSGDAELLDRSVPRSSPADGAACGLAEILVAVFGRLRSFVKGTSAYGPCLLTDGLLDASADISLRWARWVSPHGIGEGSV